MWRESASWTVGAAPTWSLAWVASSCWDLSRRAISMDWACSSRNTFSILSISSFSSTTSSSFVSSSSCRPSVSTTDCTCSNCEAEAETGDVTTLPQWFHHLQQLWSRSRNRWCDHSSTVTSPSAATGDATGTNWWCVHTSTVTSPSAATGDAEPQTGDVTTPPLLHLQHLWCSGRN